MLPLPIAAVTVSGKTERTVRPLGESIGRGANQAIAATNTAAPAAAA